MELDMGALEAANDAFAVSLHGRKEKKEEEREEVSGCCIEKRKKEESDLV